MIEYFTFQSDPNVLAPKRLRKYSIIWCSKGMAEVVVDDKSLKVPQNSVLTITSGQIQHFKELGSAEGSIVRFTLDFFSKDDTDLELLFHNGLFCHFDLNEVISIINHQFISNQLDAIRDELAKKPYQYLYSLHSRIQLILIEINRSKVACGGEIYKPDALFLKFLELVRNNFEFNYTLAELAVTLNTTEAKLNEQSKLHTGRTAQSVIHGLIASEAKRLMLYGNLSVKETAFKLGFKDQFYFSNFFKKHSGISPTAYRELTADNSGV